MTIALLPAAKLRLIHTDASGETLVLRATPLSIRFGRRNLSASPQWLLLIHDHDCDIECEIALADCDFRSLAETS